MQSDRTHVCPVELAGGLDNGIRRWLQNPDRILGPYVREGMNVLDLGCGPGVFSIPMARMVGKTGKVISAELWRNPPVLLRLSSAAAEFMLVF